MVRFEIDMKSWKGFYTSFQKDFNDERHYQNWCAKMESYGNKIVGERRVEI